MNKLQVKSWSPDEARGILARRLELAKKHRKENFEAGWESNESLLFRPGGDSSLKPTLSYSSMAEVFQAQANTPNSSIHVPRVAQNLRFLHSQMSANPPSVIPQPTSNELTDRRATEAADDVIKYGRYTYKLQEYLDLVSLSTLTYGTGFVKSYHDPHAGEVLRFDPDSGEIEMHGDYKCRPMLIWDIWFDRDPNFWEDVRYVFERKLIPYEQACSIWPEYAEAFANFLVDAQNHPSKISSNHNMGGSNGNQRSTNELENSMVEVYEYTEKGLPENGMAGRRCFHLEDGTLLGKMTRNPHPKGMLPYGILTDIDVPGEIYGRTTVDYALRLAQVVDTLDNMTMNNIDLHGSVKLVVFGGADSNEEDYSNNPVDIITVDGTHAHAPYQLKPASVSSDVYNLRAQMIDAIDGVMGVTEALKGQVNRELSGFANQTAINAANMVRHRLFNKYTALVEFVYKTYLMSVVDNWRTARKLEILGTEDAPTIRYLEGADIASGYVVQVEYGVNFSLDPAMRREEIMQAREVLKEAGVNPKKIVQMLRYNEIDGLFDAAEVARKRQLEIFERAIEKYEKTGQVDIEPANVMRKAYHLEMAEAGLEFTMTRDFLELAAELREAIYAHLDDREKLAAETAAPPPEAPGQPPGAPMPGMPLVPDIGGVL